MDPVRNPQRGIFRRLYKLLRSSIGLLCILTAYSVGGAVLFKYLEGGHEEQEKEDILDMRENIIDRILATSRSV